MDQFWHSVAEVYTAFSIPINVAITILVAIIARAILLRAAHRVVHRLITGAKKKNGEVVVTGTVGVPASVAASRQVQRTKTMGAVLTSFITWMIVGVTAIQVMSELGVSVGAIIASAGIATAALGFGAQNVVKDVLNGMFMVFEDQFGVGDVVDLGLASGTVENVGVRLTTLRDEQGTVWFVRNGEIQRVGNKSYAVSVKSPILRTPAKPAARTKKTTAS
jgi:small-conductance mechanosensitive channel